METNKTEEFIRQAKLDWGEETNIETIKDALEACYMNGDYDEIGGDVEAPTGHYYQIENWIVTCDDQGNKVVGDYETVEEAEKVFELLERDFSKWLNEQEGE
jgi:hypothetical protein